MSDTSATAGAPGQGGQPARPAAGSIRNPLARALIVLTFVTGLVDAASYLGLGHVFTANMTGNVVLLGFGIAGSGGLPVLAPIVSLASFLLGAGAGGMVGKRIPPRPEAHVTFALAVEVAMIAIAGIVAAAVTVTPGTATADIVIALLAFAMGARNATVRRLAVPDLTTTVLTMTLTALAVESPLAGGTGAGSVRRIIAVLAMGTGALVGALLLKSSLAATLFTAAALGLFTAAVYVPLARRAE